jgi:hypothetical protein
MWDLCRLTWWVLGDLFRPRAKLEAEILVLRQQINVLRRTLLKLGSMSGGRVDPSTWRSSAIRPKRRRPKQ